MERATSLSAFGRSVTDGLVSLKKDEPGGLLATRLVV
jgi:hypothetical protein